MPKQLTAQTATITTAAVEVKTLTVSGKQVTLAVFRQLREEPLIADDGTLNGVPWGYVNYHPDKCEGSGHMHYVWQQGSELLRSRIIKTPDEPPHSEAALDRWITAATREHLHGRPTGFVGETPLKHNTYRELLLEGSCGPAFFAVEGKTNWTSGSMPISWTATAHELAIRAFSLSPEHLRPARQFSRDRIAEHFPKALAGLDALVDSWEMAYPDLRSEGNAALAAELERRQRHRAVRKALADLPQLFIAV